jgi:saccharopine dehydrogenase-like NADP-dependent oxidoreductase
LEDAKWSYIKNPAITSHRRDFNFIGNQKIQQVAHPEHFTIPYYFRKKGLKTFRFWAGFPDHADSVIRSLIDLKFHDDRLVNVAGIPHRKDWLLMLMLKDKGIPPNYEEWENLWATIEGVKDGKTTTIFMECLVPPRPEWRDAGCNYDTGLPIAILAEMLHKNEVTKRGTFAMEAQGLIPRQLFFEKLAQERMIVHQNGMPIN